MKRNVGEFSLLGFVLGIVISVSLGFALYGQFHFQQQPSTQVTSQARLDALAQKQDADQRRIDSLEEQMKRLELEANTLKAARVAKKQKHR